VCRIDSPGAVTALPGASDQSLEAGNVQQSGAPDKNLKRGGGQTVISVHNQCIPILSHNIIWSVDINI
jgi:hypothetical protein